MDGMPRHHQNTSKLFWVWPLKNVDDAIGSWFTGLLAQECAMDVRSGEQE
jgi:hypothetical protein